MRIERRDPSVKDCIRCGEESCEERFNALYEGDKHSPILMLRYRPSLDEATEQRMWCDPAGYFFRKQFADTTGAQVSDLCTTFIVRCPHDKTYIRHVRNCLSWSSCLLQRPWRLIICAGKEPLSHVFLRSGKTPALDVLAGRVVSVPEYPGIRITTIPPPEGLTLLDADDTIEYVEGRRNSMRKALITLKKEIELCLARQRKS